MNKPTYTTGIIQSLGYRVLREHVVAVLDQHDLTPTQWAMLGIILDSPDGVRQSVIAQTLRVKPPLITNITKMFEERNIVDIVPNQFDGRAKLLAISNDGKKFTRLVEQNLAERLRLLLDGVSDAELQTYHKVLTTIIANDAKLNKSL